MAASYGVVRAISRPSTPFSGRVHDVAFLTQTGCHEVGSRPVALDQEDRMHSSCFEIPLIARANR
jgi:hypothetical protein